MTCPQKQASVRGENISTHRRLRHLGPSNYCHHRRCHLRSTFVILSRMVISRKRNLHLHFTDKETDIQKKEVVCPGPSTQGREARMGTSLGRVGGWVQEWELPWRCRKGPLLGYSTRCTLWIPEISTLPNPVGPLLPLSCCLSATLAVTTLSRRAPALPPGHCTLPASPSFWPALPAPLPIPLFCRAGPLWALSLRGLICSHGITSHHVLATPQCVSQAQMLPMCSSLTILTPHLTSFYFFKNLFS